MKRMMVYAAAACFILSACGKGKPTNNTNNNDTTAVEKKDSIVLAVDTFHVVKKEEGCQGDEPCAFVDLYYELIQSPSLPVHDSVNNYIKSITESCLSEMSSNELGLDLDKRADDFINLSKEFKEEGGGWDWSFNTSIYQYFTEIITVNTGNGGYQGGAHPNYGYYCENFFTETGNRVKLTDLFTDIDKLTKIGEKYFRRDLQIPDNQSLNEFGFEFPDDQFYLNDNFEFTTNLIVFQYNSYEVGPYAAGAPSAAIPLSEVQDIMKMELTPNDAAAFHD